MKQTVACIAAMALVFVGARSGEAGIISFTDQTSFASAVTITTTETFDGFGNFEILGTGSVVVRDLPAFTLVAGSPARVFGHVCRCRTKLNLEGSDTCSKCGTQYDVSGSQAISIRA